jgi:hypothetical protein
MDIAQSAAHLMFINHQSIKVLETIFFIFLIVRKA